MTKLSANLGFLWRGLPLLDQISAAANAGYQAVELHWPYETDPREVRQMCDQCGVTLLSLNSPLGHVEGGDFGLAACSGREEEFRASVETAINYAMTANATSIHVMAGNAPKTDEAFDLFCQNLLWVESQTDELQFLIEPLNSIDRADYFLSRSDQAMKVIQAAGLVRTQIMYDVYHVGLEGQEPLTEFYSVREHVGHVQIASVPARNEPYLGETDIGSFIKSILADGYAGWFGCEYTPTVSEETGFQSMTDWLSKAS